MSGGKMIDLDTGGPLDLWEGFLKWLTDRPQYQRTSTTESGGSGTPPAGSPTTPKPAEGADSAGGGAQRKNAAGQLVFYRSQLQKEDGSADS